MEAHYINEDLGISSERMKMLNEIVRTCMSNADDAGHAMILIDTQVSHPSERMACHFEVGRIVTEMSCPIHNIRSGTNVIRGTSLHDVIEQIMEAEGIKKKGPKKPFAEA